VKRSHILRVGVVAATLVAGTLAWTVGGTASAATGNPIVAENQKAGSDGWQVPADGYTVADDVKKQVKGFVTTETINPGQSVGFKITTNPAASIKLDIYRLGYYGGLGGRKVKSVSSVATVKQPSCKFASATRTTDCSNWSTSYTLATDSTWLTGVYIAVFTTPSKFQSVAPFWIADNKRNSDVVFLSSLNTYQAYNAYPFDDTNPDAATSPHGYSLYDFNSASGTPASKVSFDRPFSAEYGGAGEGGLFDFEPMAIAFLEKNGYDVSYTNDIALDADPSLLQRHKAVVIGGHSEYWTGKAYDGAIAARSKGVGLAFMSSNEIYWQVRYENNRRILVCYKHYDWDPIQQTDPSLNTIQWRELGRPEQTLIGVQFPFNGNQDWGGQPYVPTNTSNWTYAGTGMTSGKKVDGEIVGYEIDNLDPSFPKPPGTGYTTLAKSPFINFQGSSYTHNSSIYLGSGGNYVWATGTMAWSWALAPGGSSDGLKDNVRPQMQIMTNNVLKKMIATAGSPAPVPTGSPKASASPTGTPKPSPTGTPKPSTSPSPTTPGTYPGWAPNTFYAVGAKVSYQGKNYQCLQQHTSEVGWEPNTTPALWKQIA
jgi:hypothetical protein